VGEIPALNLEVFQRQYEQEAEPQQPDNGTERIKQPELKASDACRPDRQLDIVHTDRNVVARSCKPNRGLVPKQ
jgi:hypothetical protein